MLLERPTEGNSTLIAVKDTVVNDTTDHINHDHRQEKPSISTFFGNVNDKPFYGLDNFTNKVLRENVKLQILDIRPLQISELFPKDIHLNNRCFQNCITFQPLNIQHNADYLHCANPNLNLAINDAVIACVEIQTFPQHCKICITFSEIA
ncbi:hypothetical protein TNCT_87551 [Trichonephila clavata]|uniref:Uncharacterized protein n=1 Tax=Trichonephila clavata TaxID=2740835 RepID=A0A8X6I071_TRICU|nr:hypothetical protein TNCT_87551 [Trichonephila clavata]